MTVDVFAAPHPFRMQRTHTCVEPGLTIAEIVERVQPHPVLGRHALVEIGVHPVPRELWDRVRVKDGASVGVRVIPGDLGGGGDKDPRRTILTIAATIATASIATGGIFNLSGPMALTAAVGTPRLGSVRVNALTP